MLKEIIKPAFILFLVCVVISGALAVVNGVTAPIIEDMEEKELRQALSAVFPEADEFSEAVDHEKLISMGYQPGNRIMNLYTATTGGEITGYIVEVVSRGYGGNIKMLIGIDTNLSIIGTEIISHSESPGIGSKADGEYMDQYLGVVPEKLYQVVKAESSQDGDIEAITGATVTCRAITNGVSEAAELVRSMVKGGE